MKLLGVFLVCIFIFISNSPAQAVQLANCEIITCEKGRDGIFIEVSRGEHGQHEVGPAVGATARRRFEVMATPACPGNNPNLAGALDGACQYMITACAARTDGPGPMTWYWRRDYNTAAHRFNTWHQTGASCATSTPTTQQRPTITPALLQHAFGTAEYLIDTSGVVVQAA